ncbi:hypothetical protein A2W14_02265 [Candidatus Gottesmanbacteria bacterium RBG_16_37_8]|uniref:Uncharacterized protein n=1 Tax=Candidatus Gottesmanbacteria bacterium RBG_16_37_8 TaxID=1798371 RepID=A0A1F5YRC6_9BACT|nr:MAG: hypothetical protein A2W14_02265 [Candidatus Gottesmanbacteria bacterium RBG_16_37_8]
MLPRVIYSELSKGGIEFGLAGWIKVAIKAIKAVINAVKLFHLLNNKTCRKQVYWKTLIVMNIIYEFPYNARGSARTVERLADF